jgi:hypothetical protein
MSDGVFLTFFPFSLIEETTWVWLFLSGGMLGRHKPVRQIFQNNFPHAILYLITPKTNRVSLKKS